MAKIQEVFHLAASIRLMVLLPCSCTWTQRNIQYSFGARLTCITWKAGNLLQALEAHSSLHVGCSRFILSGNKMDGNFQNCTSMLNRISNHKCIHCWPLGVHQQFWSFTLLMMGTFYHTINMDRSKDYSVGASWHRKCTTFQLITNTVYSKHHFSGFCQGI